MVASPPVATVVTAILLQCGFVPLSRWWHYEPKLFWNQFDSPFACNGTITIRIWEILREVFSWSRVLSCISSRQCGQLQLQFGHHVDQARKRSTNFWVQSGALNSFWGKLSLQGKIGRIFLQREKFPSEGSFSLENSFPLPRNGLFSHEMKGLRKRSFYDLRESLWFSPRGKIYLKPFCLKRCHG